VIASIGYFGCMTDAARSSARCLMLCPFPTLACMSALRPTKAPIAAPTPAARPHPKARPPREPDWSLSALAGSFRVSEYAIRSAPVIDWRKRRPLGGVPSLLSVPAAFVFRTAPLRNSNAFPTLLSGLWRQAMRFDDVLGGAWLLATAAAPWRLRSFLHGYFCRAGAEAASWGFPRKLWRRNRMRALLEGP
jgi:hypothetical protein